MDIDVEVGLNATCKAMEVKRVYMKEYYRRKKHKWNTYKHNEERRKYRSKSKTQRREYGRKYYKAKPRSYLSVQDKTRKNERCRQRRAQDPTFRMACRLRSR